MEQEVVDSLTLGGSASYDLTIWGLFLEAEAMAATATTLIHTEKGFEHPVHVRFRDTDAAVGDLQLGSLGGGGQRNLDPASFGVLDGVFDQVGHDPLQRTCIALDVLGLAAGTYVVNVNGVTAEFTLDVDNEPAN